MKELILLFPLIFPYHTQVSTHAFVLMLHSHLPYYRKAGKWPFGEENLFQCMADTYLPLLKALDELLEEGISAGITVGLTPILLEQLADPYLQKGFVGYLDRLIAACEDETTYYTQHPSEESENRLSLIRFYQQHYQGLKHDFVNRYQHNVIAAFKRLQDAGAIEITTSAATHGFLPLLETELSLHLQLGTGVNTYTQYFDKPPAGIWLPECAYRPGLEAYLEQYNLDYFFTEYTAIQGSAASNSAGTRPKRFGLYQNLPRRLPDFGAAWANKRSNHTNGLTGLTTHEAYSLSGSTVAVMGRNEPMSYQVWSADHGYPGDGVYREFHKRDARHGLQYWRLTSKDCPLGDKQFYDPRSALAQAEFHAHHYASLLRQQPPGLLMVSFDTELFGHWWFEGVHWIKHLLKLLHQEPTVSVCTASEYLNANPPENSILLPESTWGQGGHYWVWDNEKTHWMWPVIHQAEHRMADALRQYGAQGDPLVKRILRQALRELLLLEGSDWPFLVTTGQAKDYAVERFNTHVQRLNQLLDTIEAPINGVEVLVACEETDNPFSEINPYHYHCLLDMFDATQALQQTPAMDDPSSHDPVSSV